MTSLGAILCAEDEEDDVFMLRRAFQRAEIEHPLLVVPDGKQAIDYLSGLGEYANRSSHPLPRLVLLDLNMPGLNGFEVIKWIRSTPATAAIPVLFLTSSNKDADVRQAYAMGANGYLVKPPSPEGLVNMAKAIKHYWLLQNRAAC